MSRFPALAASCGRRFLQPAIVQVRPRTSLPSPTSVSFRSISSGPSRQALWGLDYLLGRNSKQEPKEEVKQEVNESLNKSQDEKPSASSSVDAASLPPADSVSTATPFSINITPAPSPSSSSSSTASSSSFPSSSTAGDLLFDSSVSSPALSIPAPPPPPPPADPFTRWSTVSASTAAERQALNIKPATPYTGRTVLFEPGTATRHMNKLNGIVARNSIRTDIKKYEWFEPNPVKRARIRRANWMRHFAVAMRQNVQTVFHLRLRKQSPVK
ncbi:Ribosomal protein S21 [Phaffia rhodozyma]|uniref:Ribosomal protein S21 n=1 Tax=Phaffia rhodozyma TaxID=264483 RepID=A0A0F7SNP2_PHARH|nr:Ribosomal protein S21 [Phaffia rhodozyma]